MGHSTDIVGYTYNADEYCPDCILQAAGITNASHPAEYAEPTLDQAARRFGIDRQDERSFDSGEFPKVTFRDMLAVNGMTFDGSDWRDRCGSGGRVLGDDS